MWIDDISKIDLLFFKPYSNEIIDICKNNQYTPLTIGLFGSWGSGKSTILNFIKDGLEEYKKNIVCITINAWQLEGYDDAKVAIIESILDMINQNETFIDKCGEKIKRLLKKVNFLKLGGYLVKKGIATAGSLLTGNPLPLILSIGEDVSKINVDSVVNTLEQIKEGTTENDVDKLISKNIREIRHDFSEIIKASGLSNLVIMIDDLDRCLPKRIVEILEAIKLFLSVDNTTFIFGVDEAIIRYSIKQQYPVDDKINDISNDYIEKVIQLPIIIPKLSPKDIHNYFLVLGLEKVLKDSDFDTILQYIIDNKLLLKANTIDYKELLKNNSISLKDIDNNLMDEIQIISSCISSSLKGNPRKAKRFLNSFLLKKNLSKYYFNSNEIDYKILAKIMALYNIDNHAFQDLSNISSIFDPENGKLKDIEEHKNENVSSCWLKPTVQNWITCEPNNLYLIDLRNYFYLTRDMISNVIDYDSKYNKESLTFVESVLQSKTLTLLTASMNSFKITHNECVEEVVSILCDKYKKEKCNFVHICALFISYENMRGYIMKVIKENRRKVTIGDIPIYKEMLKIDKVQIQNELTQLKEEDLITQDNYNRIIGGEN